MFYALHYTYTTVIIQYCMENHAKLNCEHPMDDEHDTNYTDNIIWRMWMDDKLRLLIINIYWSCSSIFSS